MSELEEGGVMKEAASLPPEGAPGTPLPGGGAGGGAGGEDAAGGAGAYLDGKHAADGFDPDLPPGATAGIDLDQVRETRPTTFPS